MNSQGFNVNGYSFKNVPLYSCGYVGSSSLEGYKDHAVNYWVDGKVLWTQEYTGRNVCSGYNTVISNTPSKYGYSFLGWSDDYKATTVSYTAGSSVYHNHKDVVLYAVWTPNTYTVRYDANGGYNAPASQTKTHDVDLTLRTEQPYRSGYTFLGWSTSSTAGSASYAPGGWYTANANTTLYAVWSDSEKPVGSISSTNNVASNQTATLTFSDNAGIAGYYWGTSSNYANNSYTATSSTSATKTVSSAGTYYLTVKDTSGFLSNTTSITYYSTTLNANGGYVSPSSVLTQSGKSFTLPTPTRSNYTFSGWNTSSGGTGTDYTGSYTVGSNRTLYAQWNTTDKTKPTGSISSTNSLSASQTATLKMSDNSGITGYYWGTSSNYANNSYTATSSTSVTKTVSSAGTYYLTVKDTSGNLSDTVSITYYSTTLNANGGSVSPSSVLTQSGKSFTLPTASRSGYTFGSWNTNASGTGTTYTGTYSPSANRTLYAIWKAANIYNLGEETYSFKNYGDSDSPEGHCFGMAVTSSGYYLHLLNKSIIGGDDTTPLYSFRDTPTVRKPICHYLQIQGTAANGAERKAMVAGGSIDLNQRVDIKSDWDSCVKYVRNHAYDNLGTLNVGTWYASGGGHAVNFLYYKEVEGQPRIYIYDNNYPKMETYYYMGSDNYVHEGPSEVDRVRIKGIDLMDVEKYFPLANAYEPYRYIFASKDEIVVSGATMSYMKCDLELGTYVMYEVPNNTQEVTITPLTDNAEFQYLDVKYSFNQVNDQTYGKLKVSKKDAVPGETTQFIIHNEPAIVMIQNYTPTRTEAYKTTMTFTAETADMPSDASVHWFINGTDRGTGDKFTVEKATSDYTVQVKVLDKNGNVLSESETETVKINSGFFARLIAFFRSLFGLLPKVTQEYLGFDFIDKMLP